MANGGPSFAELLSSLNVGGRVGGAFGSTKLAKSAFDDLQKILKLEDLYRDQEKERREQARERDKKRGKGRTIGALVGGTIATILTGGLAAVPLAAGVGAGSYIGQRAAAGGVSLRTPLGNQRKARLKEIVKGDTSNIFFRQDALRKTEQWRSDINEFLKDANQRYDQSIVSSALSDTLTAYQLGGLDYSKATAALKNLKHLPAVAKGDMSVQTFRGLQDMAAGKTSDQVLKDRFKVTAKKEIPKKLKFDLAKAPVPDTFKGTARMSLNPVAHLTKTGTDKLTPQDLFNKAFNVSKTRTSMSPFKKALPLSSKSQVGSDFMFGGDMSNLTNLLFEGGRRDKKLNIRNILGSGMQRQADLRGILSQAYPSRYFKVD
tara:strand:- start:14148 stop:15272 length:1125 start_codon:yes stop_codon:yes gene_type:complete